MQHLVRWGRAFAVSPRHAIAGFAGADEVPQARIEAIAGAAVERAKERARERAKERAKERGVVTAYGRDGIPGVPDTRP